MQADGYFVDFVPQGALLYVNGVPMRITYTGGTGNDIITGSAADGPRA